MRSSTRRTILWALALVAALSFVVLSFIRADDVDDGDEPVSPSPGAPDDPGRGCGDQALTDPSDLSIDRTLARCGPGAPAARPLDSPATVRVALAERTESAAPLLVADALGELAAENVEVEVVEIDQRDAYATMVAGDIDVVVGGIDAPFFDAVHEGLDARLVLGGPVARRPGDLTEAQPGLWLRDDLISDDDEWDNVRGQTVLVAGGPGSAALYPIDTVLAQNALGANAVEVRDASSESAASRLLNADVGGAWLTELAASRVAEDDAVRLVATLPGSEAIEGTVLSPRLLGDDREVGLAYVRAIVRTINTHLADGYGDDARAALARALDVGDDEVAAGPAPLFDWELRADTTTRIQEALIEVGAVRYEEPAGERGLVDRSLATEVVGGDTGG